MHIQTFDILPVSLPLLKPYFYGGRWHPTLESLILRLGDGTHFGYAEIAATVAPQVNLAELRRELLEDFAPKMHRASFSSLPELTDALETLVDRPFTFAAAEIAWHDLAARGKGVPLYEFLGAGPVSQELTTSLDRPAGEFEEIDRGAFLDDVTSLYAAGYAHLELKIRPGWDRTMLHAVRLGAAPSQSLHIDAEAGLRDKHILGVCQVQDYMLWMFEQPLAADDFVGHYDLQDVFHVPIGLDESITSVNAAKTALRLKAAHCLKIHPVRVGGLAAAMEIVALCKENERNAWISSPLSTPIGAAAALALACVDGVTGPFEYHDPARYFPPEVCEKLPPLPELELDEDALLRITPADKPGIGVDFQE